MKKLSERVAEELQRTNYSPTLRLKMGVGRVLNSYRMFVKMGNDPEIQVAFQQIVMRLVAEANPAIVNCDSYMQTHPGSYVDDYGVIRNADHTQGRDT